MAKNDFKTTKANKKASEVKTVEEMISFETYIEQANVNHGLVASFRHEALQTEKGLQERSEVDWKKDFEAQSKRVY